MADRILPLKFRPEMEKLILEGRKICTTRTTARPIGQQFAIYARHSRCRYVYQIIDVQERPLSEIAREFHRLEGFTSPKEFVDFWDTIDGYPKYEDVWKAVFPMHFFALCKVWENC